MNLEHWKLRKIGFFKKPVNEKIKTEKNIWYFYEDEEN